MFPDTAVHHGVLIPQGTACGGSIWYPRVTPGSGEPWNGKDHKDHPLLTPERVCFPAAVFVTKHQGGKARAAVLSKAREGLYVSGNI